MNYRINNKVKIAFIFILNTIFYGFAGANTHDISSPQKNITVFFSLIDGSPYYSLIVDGKMPIKNSKLGLVLNKPFNGKYEVVSTK